MNWQEVFRIWLKNYKNDVIPVQIYIYFELYWRMNWQGII